MTMERLGGTLASLETHDGRQTSLSCQRAIGTQMFGQFAQSAKEPDFFPIAAECAPWCAFGFGADDRAQRLKLPLRPVFAREVSKA